MRLTSYLHLVPRLRMGGAIPPLSLMCPYGVYRINCNFTFTFTFMLHLPPHLVTIIRIEMNFVIKLLSWPWMMITYVTALNLLPFGSD
jgi:hypothetical protein